MKKITFFLALAMGFSACSGSNYTETPVSTYKLDQNSLKNHALVRVMAWAGGPLEKNGKNTGYQYLVIDEETGKTVRLLSKDLYAEAFFKDPVRYISYTTTDSSDFFTLTALELSDSDGAVQSMTIAEGTAIPKVKKPKIKLPDAVYSNSEFPQIEENKYPAVFGMLVQVSNN